MLSATIFYSASQCARVLGVHPCVDLRKVDRIFIARSKVYFLATTRNDYDRFVPAGSL
jgi:hypothetical protein